ncbi:MAG TPA: ABC transporter ATP-binding protein [Labilithrix sp.]|nr:ABC transporter ATP-binding protein [Labilithrix sp.]
MNALEPNYVEVRSLAKKYRAPGSAGGEHVVVSGFDLVVKKGEFVSIIGHSGCGKSTVLSIIASLTAPSSGTVVVAGREVTKPGPDRGLVFQSPSLLEWMTAHENVALGVDAVYQDRSPAERRAVVDEYLRLVGLEDHAHKRSAELSLGMRQRVGLARAFALDPKVLLLDEPFGMLDSITRLELQDVLIDVWAKDRKTAIMVTHDVDEALFLSDRIVMMTTGPSAKVGGILEVPFERPRHRISLLLEPRYRELRDRLIGFLEEQTLSH